MLSERSVINHLVEISENGKILKMNFLSPEKFIVLLKCKVEEDQIKTYYDAIVLQWIKKFSNFTATTWIVRNSYPKLKRFLFRKVFVCHRSSFNKKKPSSNMTLNQDCRAKIDFKIKFINKNTIKNDPSLKESLNMTISIEFVHSHRVRTPEAFTKLKSTAETDDVIYQYFSMGYTPALAKTYHELMIADQYGEGDEYLLNANINPTVRHIWYLYGKAKQNNWDNLSFEALMEQRKTSLVKSGGFISFENRDIVLIITPIMKKVLTSFSLDHIIVDGSDTKGVGSLLVTFLYIPSKAGALPIACIIHTESNEEFYSQLFLEVKLALEKVSNRNIEPRVLTINDCNQIRSSVNVLCPTAKIVSSKWSLCSEAWQYICSDNVKIESKKRPVVMELFYRMIHSNNTDEGEIYYNRLKGEESVTSCQLLEQRVDRLWQTRDQWMFEYDSPCMNLVEASIRITNEFIRRRCKSFNRHTMVDVVTNIIESKIRHVLIAHAKSRDMASAYTRLAPKSKDVSNASVRKVVSSKEYRIEVNKTLSKTKSIKFRIDTWCCDCVVGKDGRFCDHLIAFVNWQDTELMKTTELTDEEKCLFTDIAGGEIDQEETTIKTEVMEERYSYVETSDNDDNDNENDEMAVDGFEDEQPVSPPGMEIGDNYYYLEVKSENYDTNDPLDEYLNLTASTSQHTALESLQEKTVVEMNESVDEPSTVKTDLKIQYQSAMRSLNNEFRRLNKYFKDNPNKSNMETMQRLAKELSKIRPIERVNLADMYVTLNTDTTN